MYLVIVLGSLVIYCRGESLDSLGGLPSNVKPDSLENTGTQQFLEVRPQVGGANPFELPEEVEGSGDDVFNQELLDNGLTKNQSSTSINHANDIFGKTHYQSQVDEGETAKLSPPTPGSKIRDAKNHVSWRQFSSLEKSHSSNGSDPDLEGNLGRTRSDVDFGSTDNELTFPHIAAAPSETAPVDASHFSNFSVVISSAASEPGATSPEVPEYVSTMLSDSVTGHETPPPIPPHTSGKTRTDVTHTDTFESHSTTAAVTSTSATTTELYNSSGSGVSWSPNDSFAAVSTTAGTENVTASGSFPVTTYLSTIVTVLQKSHWCTNLNCGRYEECFSMSGFRGCQCRDGFVRNSDEKPPEQWGCICPITKLLSGHVCSEANRVLEFHLVVNGIGTDNLNGSSLLYENVTEKLQYKIEDELNRKLDPLNVTAYVTGPEIVKATPEPSSTRFRRASTVSFTVHYIIKLFSLFPESIPKNSEINTLIEALTNTSQAVSPGFFVAPQRITLIPYDYCVYGAHNCDVRTTICVFDDLSAKISCPCLPYHTSVDQRSCVFNSSVSGELLNGILKNNNDLRITLYVFIGALAMLFFALVGTILLLKLRRPVAGSMKRHHGHKNRFSETDVTTYENRLPRPTYHFSPSALLTDIDHVQKASGNQPPPSPLGILNESNQEAINPNVSTFSRRAPSHAAASSPSTVYSIYSSKTPSTPRTSAEIDSSSDYHYASPLISPDRTKSEAFRKPINAFEGPRYCSTEGMVFSMNDRPAVHQAIQQHQQSAVSNSNSKL